MTLNEQHVLQLKRRFKPTTTETGTCRQCCVNTRAFLCCSALSWFEYRSQFEQDRLFHRNRNQRQTERLIRWRQFPRFLKNNVAGVDAQGGKCKIFFIENNQIQITNCRCFWRLNRRFKIVF